MFCTLASDLRIPRARSIKSPLAGEVLLVGLPLAGQLGQRVIIAARPLNGGHRFRRHRLRPTNLEGRHTALEIRLK